MKNPRIHEAAELAHVIVLCCHRVRPGLNENGKDGIERAAIDLLEAEGWRVFRVSAEAGSGSGNKRKRDPRAANVGDLDLIAFRPDLRGRAYWIEVKRGDRDLTPEQLETVKAAADFGVEVIIVDEVNLLKEWLNR